MSRAPITARSEPLEVCLWLTPKIFDDLTDPVPGVEAFFEHYATWLSGRRVTLVFCAGNGDHILTYTGRAHRAECFDWARYNCYAHNGESPARGQPWATTSSTGWTPTGAPTSSARHGA